MNSTRREFLKTTTAALLGSVLPSPAQESSAVEIELHPETILSAIAEDFTGFGYETSAVANEGFFSTQNFPMLQLYRTLGSKGLIRIGGNVSDYSHWSPNGALASMPQGKSTVINAKVISDLGDFARAVGWNVMWGLNLGSGTKEEAVDEAVAVSTALGANLHSFEIGNEVDILAGGEGRHWKNWNFDAYHVRYLEFKKAIRAALPEASFSGPDSAGRVDWCRKFAESEAGDMKLLTVHYYRTWAGDPHATMDLLLASDPGLDDRARQMQSICQEKNLSYRFNETNSFSGGGKKGVSDVFGASLWCLDYMFTLASRGCAGVNIETDINHLHWLSHYSPIFHDNQGNYQARPTYYAMLAFAFAAKGKLIGLTLSPSPINLRAYAAKDDQNIIRLVIINKDPEHDASIEVNAGGDFSRIELFRLSGDSLNTAQNITLAGNAVSSDGTWAPGPVEAVPQTATGAKVQVPRASAAILQFSPAS